MSYTWRDFSLFSCFLTIENLQGPLNLLISCWKSTFSKRQMGIGTNQLLRQA